MRRLVLMIFIALSFGFALTNCEKGTDANEIDGIYAGTYTWTNLVSDETWYQTPTIEFKNGKYNYSGFSNSLDGTFDSGSGNFAIKDYKIIFELTYYYVPPGVDLMLIENFDHWFLKGEYEYKIDGNKLIFSKTATVSDEKYKYEFELERNK